MNSLRTGSALSATAIALIALPAAAVAQYVVPPSNPAVNQYTETLPTAGGGRDAEKTSKKGGGSPTSVLGARKTQQLNAHGSDGEAAAEVAAATAPSSTEAAGPETVEAGGGSGESKQGPPGDQAGTPGPRPKRAVDTREAPPHAALPDGSSAIGEVLSEATGLSSSGQMGALLPLAIIATIAWSLAYLWRQRRQLD